MKRVPKPSVRKIPSTEVWKEELFEVPSYTLASFSVCAAENCALMEENRNVGFHNSNSLFVNLNTICSKILASRLRMVNVVHKNDFINR